MKFLAVVFLAIAFGFGLSGSVNAATQVDLGTADSFAVFGGSGIIVAGAVNTTTITGDIGTFPTTSITGLGNIVLNGANHAGDAVTQGAKDDLVTAYNDASQTPCTDLTGQNLGNMTLTAGTYCFNSSAQLTGTLQLDAEGNPDAIFIFRIGTTLTTASDSGVSTINGVDSQACHVFWQIGSSATFGTTTRFKGNVLALASITANTGATFYGRLLARNGIVTLDNNTVEKAICENASNDEDENTDKNGNDIAIKVKKTASDYKLSSGSKKVTFTYKVTNEGDTALTDISVKDDKCDDVNYVSGDKNDDDKLDTNEEWKYTCKKTVKKTETNTVTAKGTANGEEVKDTDTAKVTVSTHGLPNTGIGPDTNIWDIISQKLLSFLSF